MNHTNHFNFLNTIFFYLASLAFYIHVFLPRVFDLIQAECKIKKVAFRATLFISGK